MQRVCSSSSKLARSPASPVSMNDHFVNHSKQEWQTFSAWLIKKSSVGAPSEKWHQGQPEDTWRVQIVWWESGGWREGRTVLSQNPCLCDANVPHQPSTWCPICVQRVMEGVLLITTLLGRPGVWGAVPCKNPAPPGNRINLSAWVHARTWDSEAALALLLDRHVHKLQICTTDANLQMKPQHSFFRFNFQT